MSSNRPMPARHAVVRHASIFLAILFCFMCASECRAQSPLAFRWLSSKSDPARWSKIQDAFKRELRPDAPDPNKTVNFAFKSIERVGIVDHSALVIIGHGTTKAPESDDADERYSSAFSFNLDTGAITNIEHAQSMWHWKFKKLAQFDPSAPPDVAFTYLTCSECEPSQLLSTLHYDPAGKNWRLRRWEMDRMIWWTGEDGPVVDADILEGGDDTLSFVCLYNVLPLRGSKKDNVASRCHEVTEIADGRRIAMDVTVVYALQRDILKIRPVTDSQEVAEITAKLCAHNRAHPICGIPAVSTYDSAKLTMLGTFPHAARTSRNVKCFQTLRGDISMYSVVEACGRPDNGGGKSVGFFDYRMEDGSTVTIHWKDMLHILDVVQSDKSGKTVSLLVRK